MHVYLSMYTVGALFFLMDESSEEGRERGGGREGVPACMSIDRRWGEGGRDS